MTLIDYTGSFAHWGISFNLKYKLPSSLSCHFSYICKLSEISSEQKLFGCWRRGGSFSQRLHQIFSYFSLYFSGHGLLFSDKLLVKNGAVIFLPGIFPVHNQSLISLHFFSRLSSQHSRDSTARMLERKKWEPVTLRSIGSDTSVANVNSALFQQ